MSYSRFAIYFVPPEGPLADFGAAWLGWDIVTGVEPRQFDILGLRDITMTPMKYGFHGTLKPPFRLQDGKTCDQLFSAVSELAGSMPPANCDRLALTQLGRFLALTPMGNTAGLSCVAGACVSKLDRFRAPSTKDDLDRRRKAGLSDGQEALLRQWGYPYVMDEFRFHLTLTGNVPETDLDDWSAIAKQYLPQLQEPFVIDQIALCGERTDGRFELIQHYTLGG